MRIYANKLASAKQITLISLQIVLQLNKKPCIRLFDPQGNEKKRNLDIREKRSHMHFASRMNNAKITQRNTHNIV